MTKLKRDILEQLIEGSAEPLFVARINHPDWPVVLANGAFTSIAGRTDTIDRPLADVVEELVGRDLALEISETVRGGHETSIAVELGSREYLLVLKPIQTRGGSAAQHYAAYWRNTASGALAADSDLQQALLKAKRRIRDLTRDDPVTGLLNEASFREVLAHDWSVSAREKASLALISFSLNDFQEYLEVFGRHAADSCLRRVAQAIRRCLRRASDVAARVDVDNEICMVVLSHSPSDGGVADFAGRISAAVRELGLHHPRSKESKFVTVSYKTNVVAAGEGNVSEARFLQSVLPSLN